MAERENFSFTPGDLGIVSTKEIDAIDIGESFLDSDPNDIKFLGNKPKDDQEEEEDEEDSQKKKEDKGSKSKEEKGKKKEIKEVKVPSNEVKDDDIFSSMEQKIDEEETEEEETEGLNKKLPTKKDGQKPSQKQNEEEEEVQEEEEQNIFSSISKELVTHGIFTPDEDEEGNPVELEISTPEEFLERFQLEARRQAADVIERFLEKYGDDYKDMFENVFVKGINPIDYLNRYSKIEGISNIDLTSEENQERVVRELYRSEGRSAEYIDKKIQQHKNYGDLAEEAEEAKKVLVHKEQVSIDQAAQQKQAEIARKNQIRSEYMNSMNKIISEKMRTKDFDGIPVDKRFAEQTYEYITRIKWQTPDKQELTDFDKDVLDLSRPENHELKVKIAMLMQMAKEDPKLTKLAKRAVTKESNELFKGLKKQAMKSSGSKAKEEKEESTAGSWFTD